MKTVTTHATFVDTLSEASEQIGEIAQRVIEMVVDVYSEVVEVPCPKQGIIGFSVGPKKMTEHFCHIGLCHEHVNLGLNYGAELPDP